MISNQSKERRFSKFFPSRSSGNYIYSLNVDIWSILEAFRKLMKQSAEDKVLYLECGNGDITSTYMRSIAFSELLAVDASEERVSESRKNEMVDSKCRYQVLDITDDDPVKKLPCSLSAFDKIICFSCVDWTKNAMKALENIKSLMKPNGECMMAFVVQSPVYNAYEHLEKNPKWANYMKGDRFTPFTQNSTNSDEVVEQRMEQIGFEVIACQAEVRCIFDPREKFLRQHVIDVNHFLSRIPEDQKSEFIEDCITEIRNSENFAKNLLVYEWVAVSAKHPGSNCGVVADPQAEYSSEVEHQNIARPDTEGKDGEVDHDKVELINASTGNDRPKEESSPKCYVS